MSEHYDKIARATGAAAVAMTVTNPRPGHKWQLKEVRVHLSAVGTAGNLTVTIDSGTNVVYDTVLKTQDMTSITDMYWQPEKPIILDSTDEIDIAWANSGTKTYGVEVVYAPLF
ncbi:MAG: hypothetical protein SFH39_00045 [Candidatus Magnetobacterium sp. LHC-1]